MNVFVDIVRDVFSRASDQMAGRVTGPLHLRLILTPTMATIFAIRNGLKEARAGLKPYGWRVFTIPDERKAYLKRGWKEIRKVIVVAAVLDMGYQFYVFRAYYVFQTVILVIVLALMPYMVIRGITTRLTSLFLKRQ